MTTTIAAEAPPTTPDRARGVYLVAGAVTVVLLALAGRYGPHRDELYFVAAGHHLQWGYPDQPLLTPLVARIADQIAPGSLLALRFVPAVIIGVVVLLNAGLARELGGSRAAQLLTAITVAIGGGLLAVGHLLSTATLDLLAWTVLIRLVVWVLHRDHPRGWLLVGLAAGVGLENKSLVAFLVAALLVGILATGSLRHHFRSPWAYAGAAVAVLIWLPDLWWQAAHGWPQFDLAADIRDEYGTVGGLAQLLGLQVIMLSPLGAILVGVGLVGLWRRPEWRYARPLAIAYPILILFFVLTGGKAYYLLGLLGPLAAAGAVVIAQNWSSRRVTLFTVALGLTALFPVPALLPVLPLHTYASSFYPALNEDDLETIGWPQLVAQVRAVAATLPPEQQRTAVVVASNYGEAGALQWYGGTPPVYSGHNGFGDWGPPTSSGPVLYVGELAPAADVLTGCQRAATLHTGVDNEEDGHGVWICTGPAGSWQSAWKRLSHLSA
jgi:4-amino-4-deoxy-L-arabinose transferase-like glycosyltransferase